VREVERNVAASWLRLRTPPLALRNVVHGGRRTLAAIAGVAFALTMVFLQLGFLEAVRITAANNFEQIDFDAVLLSPRYEQFYSPGFFPLERLVQARSVEGVLSAAPFYATFNLWRCPAYPADSSGRDSIPAEQAAPGPLERWLKGARLPRPLQRRETFVIGIELERNPFRPPIRDRIEAARPALQLGNRVLFNEQSHPDFGWDLRDRVTSWELGNKAVTIAGGYPMLRGFAADSSVICSDENFLHLCLFPPGRTNFAFLKLRPHSIDATIERLRERLPPDVQPFSREQILAREIDHWVNQTSTGQLFAFGVLVAMIVAAVVVYQVLSNDVREHLPEYATLKAMGYSFRRLAIVVIAQSIIYMLISYLIAVVLGFAVYRVTEELAGIPMRMTASSLLITLALAIVVGLLSGFLSLSRLRAAQPAELF
jgi:putative ABC transport system permease protein